ncbi:hypothetical protein FB451DRAFT_1380366 [Mycena latifolia]|nr:hypothetical protein FB451DRAFT_1380366 [Mycena latifolia]
MLKPHVRGLRSRTGSKKIAQKFWTRRERLCIYPAVDGRATDTSNWVRGGAFSRKKSKRVQGEAWVKQEKAAKRQDSGVGKLNQCVDLTVDLAVDRIRPTSRFTILLGNKAAARDAETPERRMPDRSIIGDWSIYTSISGEVYGPRSKVYGPPTDLPIWEVRPSRPSTDQATFWELPSSHSRPAPFFLPPPPCCTHNLQSISLSVHSAPTSVHLRPLTTSTSSPSTSNTELPSSAHSSSVPPASRRVFDAADSCVGSWAFPFLNLRHFARVGPPLASGPSGITRDAPIMDIVNLMSMPPKILSAYWKTLSLYAIARDYRSFRSIEVWAEGDFHHCLGEAETVQNAVGLDLERCGVSLERVFLFVSTRDYYDCTGV